jgi:hypothetical protein
MIMRGRGKPLVHVEIVGSQSDAPGGIGVAGFSRVDPAIANGVVTMIRGVGLWHYPFGSDHVKAALRAAA